MDDDSIITYDFRKRAQAGELTDLTDGKEMTCVDICEWDGGKNHALLCGDADGDVRILQSYM